MAHRRSPHRPHSNTPLARRNTSTRRLPSSRKRPSALVNRLHRSTSSSHALGASTPPSSSDTPRQVLVPLHPNLRRLPSRLLLAQKESMRDGGHHLGVHVGSKRKRVLSSNENAHSGGRPTRGSGRLKRHRSISKRAFTSDEEEVGSAMDVDDTPAPWADSDGSDDEENEEDSSECGLTIH
jgi:mitogen-activated protein kinase kinase kinase 13